MADDVAAGAVVEAPVIPPAPKLPDPDVGKPVAVPRAKGRICHQNDRVGGVAKDDERTPAYPGVARYKIRATHPALPVAQYILAPDEAEARRTYLAATGLEKAEGVQLTVTKLPD